MKSVAIETINTIDRVLENGRSNLHWTYLDYYIYENFTKRDAKKSALGGDVVELLTLGAIMTKLMKISWISSLDQIDEIFCT